MSQSETSQLDSALCQLLPNEVFGAVCPINVDGIQSTSQDLEVVATWAPARQREYLAGRWCARGALAQAGLCADHDLSADPDGLPRWPEATLGSITHSKGLCAAVVALNRQFRLLGLDLERTDRIGPAAMRRVIHPAEVPFAGDDQLNASILFSLKEAFYKAQYARWRIKGNFHDLALDVDLKQGSASVHQISERFAPELVNQSNALCFRYALFANYVLSLCWLEEVK